MYADLGAVPDREFHHRVDLALVAVHATGRKQAEDMHRPARSHRRVHGAGEREVGKEGAGADGTADAGELLVHHTAGTEVEVTNLRVAHLAAGKPDCRP